MLRLCDEVLSQKCIYMKMILPILSGKMKTMQIPFTEPYIYLQTH